jgi:flagellar basal body-associated protein FliL
MKQEETANHHEDIETPITREEIQKRRLKGFKSCSLVLKIIALLVIVSIVVMFCYLPTLLHNKEEKESRQSDTDPTHAQLPHIDTFANE